MANQLRISYDKNKLIGEGRYGRVFKGELVGENGTKVRVAVKRIQREYSSKLSKKSKDRELDHQLKLGKHPNVVQLLHWEDQGEDFRCYALELCDFSLDKVYEDPENYRDLVPNQLDFMLQLSLGLEYIHNQNLIHRDIKPENVLVISKHSDSGNPLVKWGDLGLSKTTKRGECTMTGQRGTNWYWAPEIWKMSRNNSYRLGKKDDAKEMTTIMSDIFSSGCVFFEFCTDGVHPFGEGSDIITNLSMEQSNPYNLKELKLKEDHFAYKIIKKMLENDPKTRLNLREIIPAFISLRSMVKIHETNETLNNNSENLQTRQIEKGYQTSPFISDVNQEDKVNNFVDIDEAKQQLEKMKIELHYLCSRIDPTSKEIRKITEISAKDSVGLVNMVDDDGFSPLIMICRNNRRVPNTMHQSIANARSKETRISS